MKTIFPSHLLSVSFFFFFLRAALPPSIDTPVLLGFSKHNSHGESKCQWQHRLKQLQTDLLDRGRFYRFFFISNHSVRSFDVSKESGSASFMCLCACKRVGSDKHSHFLFPFPLVFPFLAIFMILTNQKKTSNDASEDCVLQGHIWPGRWTCDRLSVWQATKHLIY